MLAIQEATSVDIALTVVSPKGTGLQVQCAYVATPMLCFKLRIVVPSKSIKILQGLSNVEG